MIYKLVIFALGSALMVTLIKENFKSGAILLAVGVCVYFFHISMEVFGAIKETFLLFDHIPDMDIRSMGLILKTLAVAYITSFGSDICSDAGEKAIANGMETAGKMIMLSMALPMLTGIFRSVAGIIGQI